MKSDWLDIELLEDYLDGKLDAKAMHKIEKQALEDPFVAQALAGLSESPKRSRGSVSLLQKQLYERISQQQVQKKETVFTWQRLSVAAAAAVMFISVSVLFFMRDNQNREQQTKSHPKRVDVNIAPLPLGNDPAVKNGDPEAESYAATISGKPAAPVTTASLRVKKEADSNKLGQQVLAAASAVQKTTANTDTAGVVKATTMAKTVNARVAAVVAPAISSPVGGWAKFDSYLNDNNKLIAAGKSGNFVELSFLIDSDGNPSDIKVEKSGEKVQDEEAVRLIKEGPKWEIPKTTGGRVVYTIAF